MDLGLDGARALVGGGSSGLGLAVGTALAGEGARVALAARPSERLDAAAGGIDGSVAVGVDLETADGPASAVGRAVEAFGGLDLVLVNSGGPSQAPSTISTTPAGNAPSRGRCSARSGRSVPRSRTCATAIDRRSS